MILLLLPAFLALIVIVAVAYRRYGEGHHVTQDHWHRTDEVFRDPSTGRLMRVWLDPQDQSRHYLRDAPARPD